MRCIYRLYIHSRAPTFLMRKQWYVLLVVIKQISGVCVPCASPIATCSYCTCKYLHVVCYLLSLPLSLALSLSPSSLCLSYSIPPSQVQQDTSWLKMLAVLFEVLVVPQVAIGIFAYGWIWDHPILCCLVWLHVRKENDNVKTEWRGREL